MAPHHKAIIPFFLIMIISLVISPNRWISFQDLLLFLSYFALYFIVLSNVKNKKQFYSIIHILFMTTFIVSFYTIIQYYKLDPFLKEITQLTSTIGQRNWISNYLFMLMPLIFIFFLTEKKTKIKITYFLLLSVIYLNLIILQSLSIRITIIITAILGVALLFKLKLVKVFLQNKKWLILLIATFILISVFYSTDNTLNRSPSILEQRMLPAYKGEDLSINRTLLTWNTAYKMLKNRPLFGVGIGIFKMQYLFYQGELLEDLPGYLPYYTNSQEAHNEYLQLLVELGILGLVSFLFIFYFFYKKILFVLFYENVSNREKTILWGLLMGISGFLIHCLFTFPLHVPALGMTFFGLMGVTVAYVNIMKDKNDNVQKEETSKNIEIESLIIRRKSLLPAILISVIAVSLAILLVFRPYHAELLHFQGLRHTVDQDYNLALTKFEKAYRFNPYDGKNLLALGGTYLNLGNYEKAEEALIEAKHYYTDVNIFYNLGLIYAQKGLFLEAEEEFKQSVYLNPHFTKGYHSIGLLYFQEKEFDKAIKQWNTLLTIEPDFPNKYIVLNNIGIAYQKKQMSDNALDYFLEALKSAPAGSPVIKEIENEISKIYKNKLDN